MNRNTRILQFNKTNKEFITVLQPVDPSWLNTENYYYSEEVQIDEENEVVVGNWDSWRIAPISELPFEVREDDLNILARERIMKTYPLESQLNILGSVLESVADANAIECEELKAMNDFITEVRRVNGLRKEFFASSSDYTYVSTEDMDSKLKLKYEGAIDAYTRSVVDN